MTRADSRADGGGRSADRRPADWGPWLAMILVVIALAAPLLAPAEPYEQFDPAAGRHLPPLSSRYAIALADGGWLLAEAFDQAPDGITVERLGERVHLPASDLAPDTGASRPKKRLFLLGTDKYGRDVLSRVLFGARISLGIGLLAAALAFGLGLVVGGVAATSGPLVDGVLMRTVDALLMFPRLFLLLALTSLFDRGDWLVPVVLGATGWMGASRLVRAEILSLERRDWVTAARASGQHPFRIFTRHLLPSALNPLIVDTSLRIGDIILLEAALSFLGLGIRPPTPSWGNMVADGTSALVSAWWVSAFPGLAIALTAVGLNLLGDRLRDRLDPRSDPRQN